MARRAAIEVERAARIAAIRAASQHIGSIGERITTAVTVRFVRHIDTQFGTMNIVSMRDDAGNTIVAKGKFNANEGDKMTIKATIKAHDEYNGEKQTIVQRVAA
jgi:hypothetical protein